MNNDTLLTAVDRIEEKLIAVKELQDRVLELEQKGSYRPGDGGSADGRSSGTLGDKVLRALDSDGTRDLLGKTGRVTLSIKTAGDPTTTTQVGRTTSMGPAVPLGPVLGIQNVLRQTPGGGSSLSYPRYTSTQGAAGVQAVEGDLKAAMTADFTMIDQSAITVAAFAKASKQSLADTGELRRVIDGVLARSVETKFDDALTGGVVAPAFAGLEALAVAYTSLVYTAIPDAASEAISFMQVNGFAPDAIVMNPADWLSVVTAKATADGHYLSGQYLDNLPMGMRGLRVALSPGLTAGKILVLDSSFIDLLMPETLNVTVGLDGQDFTKNLMTILAELRFIPVFRAAGAARLITPKAP